MTKELAVEDLLREACETSTEIPALLKRILDVVVRSAGAERGLILLTKRDGTTYAQVERNMTERELPDHESAVSRTIVRKVLDSGKSVLLEDAMASNEFIASRSVSALMLRSVICAPLTHDDTCFGVIYIENRAKAGMFDENTRQLTEQLSRSVSRRLATHVTLRSVL